ncbi:hypothetical protein [Vibrio sp. WJH972]
MIVNSENNVSTLSKRELIDLYMGKTHAFPNGLKTITLDQNTDSKVRQKFYHSLVNKSVAQVNAYWARLLFTGRATPPRIANRSEEIRRLVQENPNAIGYIDSDFLDSSVKEVFRVE